MPQRTLSASDSCVKEVRRVSFLDISWATSACDLRQTRLLQGLHRVGSLAEPIPRVFPASLVLLTIHREEGKLDKDGWAPIGSSDCSGCGSLSPARHGYDLLGVENPEIYFFTPKFKFFFDQNLDFVLGRFLHGIADGRHDIQRRIDTPCQVEEIFEKYLGI